MTPVPDPGGNVRARRGERLLLIDRKGVPERKMGKEAAYDHVYGRFVDVCV